MPKTRPPNSGPLHPSTESVPAPKALGEFKNVLEKTSLDRQLALIRALLNQSSGGSKG